MSLLKIDPCDSLFFGTGKQFNFGDNDFIDSKTMPYPSVFFGAIFTAILTKNDEFRKAFLNKKEPDHKEILKIGQIYLYNEAENKIYIKAPCDIFLDETGDISIGEFKENNKLTSSSFKFYLDSPVDNRGRGHLYNMATEDYIEIGDLYDSYMRKQEKCIDIINEEKIFSKETKIGIAINKDKKAVEKDKLYKVQQISFVNDNYSYKSYNGWSYIVEYELLKDKYLGENNKEISIQNLKEGYLKLGGEAKACRYKVITNEKIDEFNKLIKKEFNKKFNNRFRVIFTSDSYFDENLDLKSRLKENFDFLGMANNKPIYIGGIDLKDDSGNKKVRRMYKGYAAGTVLLLQVKNNKHINIKTELDSVVKLKKDENNRGFNKYIIMEE